METDYPFPWTKTAVDHILAFKHALVQDAAYGTLLREPRRALHARTSGRPTGPA
jgi:predicted ATPase